MSTFIEVNDVKKDYVVRKSGPKKGFFSKSTETLHAVKGVSFTIAPGETVGIIGESGCGKSTLGRMLVGLDGYTGGEILYDGKTSQELKREDRLAFHRMCQMVFQNPFDTFDGRFTILRILMEPLELHTIGADEKERHALIVTALEEGGLKPASQYLDRYPHELSGGQLQRVSIIRAMLLKPKFLVADEPVSMLDVSVQKDIIKMLQNLTKKEGTSLIFISHDIATTQYISDKILVMYFGEVVERGVSADVIHDPQHEYTKLLINSVASVDPREGRRYQRRMKNA